MGYNSALGAYVGEYNVYKNITGSTAVIACYKPDRFEYMKSMLIANTHTTDGVTVDLYFAETVHPKLDPMQPIFEEATTTTYYIFKDYL